MATEDYTAKMSEKTTDELLHIVEYNAKDYQPEALEAAKTELTIRGISFNEGSKAYVPLYFAEENYEKDNRFWEYLIDYVVIILFLGVIIGLTGIEGNNYLISSIAVFVYYFVMEAAFSKTIGKMILKLRVVDIDGGKPSIGAIALRSLCRLIPFEPLSFLFGDGWAKDHSFHGNWHDNFSKTYVVSEKRIKENMPVQS